MALNFGISSYLYKRSYTKGREFVSEFFSGERIEKMMTSITAMGAITIGALASSTVAISTPLSLTFGEKTIEIQSLINAIAPSLLPFGAVLLTLYLLNKKLSVNKVLFILIGAAIVLGFFGIL